MRSDRISAQGRINWITSASPINHLTTAPAFECISLFLSETRSSGIDALFVDYIEIVGSNLDTTTVGP